MYSLRFLVWILNDVLYDRLRLYIEFYAIIKETPFKNNNPGLIFVKEHLFQVDKLNLSQILINFRYEKKKFITVSKLHIVKHHINTFLPVPG